MAEDNIEFYRHLFEETLFLVPDSQTREQGGAAATAPGPPEEPASGDTAAAPKYQLLGENRKGLVIAVSLPDKDFEALPKNEFLTKVLSAIQRSPADVAFVNIRGGEKLRVLDLSRQTQLQHLVAFGPGLLDMAAEARIELYKPAAIGDIPLLLAHPLEDIERDVSKKKLLWNSLQAVFLK